MASTRTITARRRLDELYKKGVEVRFDEGPDGPIGKVGPFLDPETGRKISAPDSAVCMWVQPPNPVQRDISMREGQARRARAIVRAKREKDSEEHLTIIAFLADMSDETLVDYVLLQEQGTRMAEAEREILALDEWKDMTAYQDAMRQFEEMDPEERDDDPEWQAMLELDDKYARQVAQRQLELSDAQRDVFRMMPRDRLEERALDKRADMVGSQAFISEYEKHMLFYSVRDVDDNTKMFYDDANQIASQPDEVLEVLREALFRFIGDEAEAKNSQGAALGSDSSEPPVAPETFEASTPKEQTA